MKKQTKAILISSFLGAITYSGLMAAFDYYHGEDFRIGKFIFNFIFFAFIMGYIAKRSFKKQAENKNNK